MGLQDDAAGAGLSRHPGAHGPHRGGGHFDPLVGRARHVVRHLRGPLPVVRDAQLHQGRLEGAGGQVGGVFRNAVIGLCSSAVSDVVSNSIRVVKTKKQTAKEALTYMATILMLYEEGGMQGIFLRGLGTKLITNGVSAIIFTILWKEIEKKLTAPASKDDKKKL